MKITICGSMAFANVLDYKGGKQDWIKAGLPLVKS